MARDRHGRRTVLIFDVANSSGKAWGVTTINGSRKRGTGILNNELYIGRLIWNRQRFSKDPETGKRVTKANPPEAWVIEDVPELRIVPQELWDAAMARKEDHRDVSERMSRAATVRYWDRRRPRYLLSGLLTCGACGGGYSKISATQFGCSAARDRGTCGNRLNIRRDVLEATVLDGLRTRLMGPELFKVFAEEFTSELNRHRREEAQTRDALEAELCGIDRKLQRIVEAISGGVDAMVLKNELFRLEERKQELTQRLQSSSTPKPLLHPAMAEIYRTKVADLHQAFKDESLGAAAMETVRSLIDEVVLTPVDGELRIDLKGDLAGILALTAGSKRGAPEIRDASQQIKAVAEARSHRELTLPAVAI